MYSFKTLLKEVFLSVLFPTQSCLWVSVQGFVKRDYGVLHSLPFFWAQLWPKANPGLDTFFVKGGVQVSLDCVRLLNSVSGLETIGDSAFAGLK